MSELQDANEVNSTPTWTTESGETFPLFAFDQPQAVRLPNGSVHYFRKWDLVTEKRREDLLKTIVLTSPAIINGEQPRDVKTDFSRSMIGYYDLMIDSISGVKYNGNTLEDKLEANKIIDESKGTRIKDLIGVAIKKAAAARLYSGRIEVIKDAEEEDFDGDPFSADDLTRAVEEAEKKREIYALSLDRNIRMKQEIGVEQIGNTGRTTKPTHLIEYDFNEPSGDEFSKWELKARRGYQLTLKKGGERAEMFYNLDTISHLFDSLINDIRGASINGSEIHLSPDRDDAGRKGLLGAVPVAVKKLTVATLFNEMSTLGNV